MTVTTLSTTILIYDPAGRLQPVAPGYLRSQSYIVLSCADIGEFVQHLESEPGFVFADALTPKFDAERILAELNMRYPEVPLILAAEPERIPEYFGLRFTTEFPLLTLPATRCSVDYVMRHAKSMCRLLHSTAQHRDTLEARFEAVKMHADGVERENVRLQREHSELSKAANRQRAQLKSQECSRRKLVRVRSAVDSARDAMLIMDVEGRVEYSNPAFDEMFGKPGDTSGPYSLERIFVDEGKARSVIDNVSVLGTFTCELQLRRKNEGRFPAVVHANRIDSYDQDSGGILFIFADITEQERLRHEAQFDALTGSYGRRYFLEILAGNASLAGRHGHGLALAMCDLDKFKMINDTHGHRMGDKVLMTFAEVVRSEIRQEDVLGRLGGDEFMILFPHVEAATVASCLERIRLRLSEIKFRTDMGMPFHVSVTMGAVDYPDRRMSVEEYVELADQSLYKAKELGRNCIVVNGLLAEHIVI